MDYKTFEKAIRENPNDLMARQAYGDWLEEQDGGKDALFAAYIKGNHRPRRVKNPKTIQLRGGRIPISRYAAAKEMTIYHGFVDEIWIPGGRWEAGFGYWQRHGAVRTVHLTTNPSVRLNATFDGTLKIVYGRHSLSLTVADFQEAFEMTDTHSVFATKALSRMWPQITWDLPVDDNIQELFFEAVLALAKEWEKAKREMTQEEYARALDVKRRSMHPASWNFLSTPEIEAILCKTQTSSETNPDTTLTAP